MLRTLAERIFRNRIIKRRLPAVFGSAPLYVSPDSQLKYLRLGAKAFDAQLLRIASEEVEAGSIVWDIGANVGVFTFAAASKARGGTVVAVEADIWLAQLIRKSAALKQNASLQISVLPAAVSDRNSVEVFMISGRGRARNSLASEGGRSQMGGAREEVLVPTYTLDTLLDHFPSPSFVKIDVEGSEKRVLEGASKLIETTRPSFYVEVGNQSAEWIADVFKNSGYKLYDGSIPRSERQPISGCAFNTLAIPHE